MISIYNLEDYKIIRDGIKFLLLQDKEFITAGDSDSPADLYDTLEKKEVDILILDIYLDGMENTIKINGFDVCEYVVKNYPATKVVALSMYNDADKVKRMMDAGARGFISKKAGFEELISGIKTVYSGKRYICVESAKNFKNIPQFVEDELVALKPKTDFFSKREKEVLELMAKGYASKAIGKKLFITEKTVESHRKNMVTKAGVKNTMELISFATGRGIIKL